MNGDDKKKALLQKMSNKLRKEAIEKSDIERPVKDPNEAINQDRVESEAEGELSEEMVDALIEEIDEMIDEEVEEKPTSEEKCKKIVNQFESFIDNAFEKQKLLLSLIEEEVESAEIILSTETQKFFDLLIYNLKDSQRLLLV